jgi:paraquat-inducible protein B
MKAKLSPAAVGMFVLGAFVLLVGLFLSFGGRSFFVKPGRFLAYFDETVSGLDPGAPVKFYGVRIGRVAAVNVRYDAATRRSAVQTVCEINRSVLTDTAGNPVDLKDPAVLQSLIDKGLRAKLSFTGITGLLYVELDLEDPKKYPAKPALVDADYPVVPSIPSPIAEVQQSLIEIVANLKRVDFHALSLEARGLIERTQVKVEQFDVKALNERIARTAAAVEQLVSSPDAKQVFANLNSAIADLRATLARIDGQVGPVSDELKKTLADAQGALKSLDGAAVTTRRFVEEQGGVGEEVTQALRQIADAADALQRLADYVGRQPNALISGKKKN